MADLKETFHESAMRDTKLVRDVLDAALREWDARSVTLDERLANVQKVLDTAERVSGGSFFAERQAIQEARSLLSPSLLDFLAGKILAAMLPLPGWTCACGVFNGTMKQENQTCRACGQEKP